MAPAQFGKLIILNRFQTGLSLLPLFLYTPVGVMLTVLRCFIFIHALLVYFLFSKVPFIRSVLSVLFRCMLGVCGLIVIADDGCAQKDHQRLVFVANHMTSLDPFILSLVMRFTMVIEPLVSGSDLIHFSNQLCVPGEKSKEESLQFIKKNMEDSRLPLLLFPEGGRSNGFYGLMKFRVLPFQLDASIQPVAINTRRWFPNINISTFSSPWWLDLLICFFVPITVYNIRYLPLTASRESETSEHFSERVQSNLAKGLGATATDMTLADVRESIKAQQRGTPAAVKLSAPASQPSTSSAPVRSEPKQEVEVVDVATADPELRVMLKQVRDVLPHAGSHAVLHDLEKTRDVDLTITNILEGKVDIEPSQPQPSPSKAQVEASTFKAASFPKSTTARQLSLQERKEAMYEAARKRYKEKHGIP